MKLRGGAKTVWKKQDSQKETENTQENQKPKTKTQTNKQSSKRGVVVGSRLQLTYRRDSDSVKNTKTMRLGRSQSQSNLPPPGLSELSIDRKLK